jgi:hypothetical protein
MADVTKICDPELYPLSEAIEHARKGAEVSPGFEIDIVRFLQAHCRSERVTLPTVFRGLEVLGGMLGAGTPNESRLIALLRPFLRSDNPRIASKCVLVLGRQSCSTKWLNDIMSELDGRMRANLIESLWSRKEPEIELVLRKALQDPHPRVAANAVYGLCLLGDEVWAEGLRRLIGSNDPAFRISGIWVLRSTGAPDAPARIKRLIRDEDPRVRRAAFDAIKHLRERGANNDTAVTEAPSSADPVAAA